MTLALLHNLRLEIAPAAQRARRLRLHRRPRPGPGAGGTFGLPPRAIDRPMGDERETTDGGW